MTKPNEGKQETRIQKSADSSRQRNFIDLTSNAPWVSVILTCGLTIFLASKKQYAYALCGAALSLVAATSDRLKRLRIGFHGLYSEWLQDRSSRRAPKRRPGD